MPNSNFFPVRHPTENPFLLLFPNMRGKIPVFSRATPTRSECQPLLCFFRNSMLSEAKHPVCEGGNVSTVARNMCFSPRSKILGRTFFVWSTRQRCRGYGRNVLFLRACLLRQQDPRCDDLREFGLQKDSPGLCEAIFIAF